MINWKTTIKEITDRIEASGNEIDREPETYRLSEKEEIVFAVVVYISLKDTDMELKLKSTQKQMLLTYNTRVNLKVLTKMQRTLG